MSTSSHTTYQVGEIVLKLRDDLNFSLRAQGETPVWLIEDERGGRFFRIGQREYTLLSLLNGKTTLATALGHSAAQLKDRALSFEEATGLCRWLVESGLATTPQSQSAIRLLQQQDIEQRDQLLRRLKNPLAWQLPLVRPDRYFVSLASALGWLFSVPMLLVFGAIIAIGAFTILDHWAEFWAMTPNIIARDNWIWLLLTWAGLKLIHETAHGVACRTFGGAVREAGVTFILFVPLPYVDVTSAWRFGSKWRRILTSAAGMIAELVIGSIAALIWSQSQPGMLQQQMHAIVLSATVVTLLFNLNPLMRFDGYYILSDLLGLPNLATHGAQACRQLGRRWLLGLSGDVPSWPEGRTWLIVTYGFAALVWRVLVCIGLILAADALFFGAGAMLAALAILAWGVVPMLKLLLFVIRGRTLERPSKTRFALSVALFAGVIWGVGCHLSWQPRLEAPVVIAYFPAVEVRPAVGGFVEELLVVDGDSVRTGQPLVRLRNEDLLTSMHELELQIEQTELRCGQALQLGEIPVWEAEQERLLGLRSRAKQLHQRQQKLVVRAPCDGLILDADLRSLHGTYVQIGEPLLRLGANDRLLALALIDPANRSHFDQQINRRVTLQLNGRASHPAMVTLTSVASRAEQTLPHHAFGAHGGGPLAVRMATSQQDTPADSPPLELASPYLLAELQLDPDQMLSLRAGETGIVRSRSAAQPLAELATEAISNWWTRHQTALREQWYQ
ncbi:MAG: efflux RND transporter periplasmic adaptor subunit [Planctomycetaceae bacterium]|nr:efflux RND transporter periplasmic adaptor subunit [Planctomycetaceae bacterium]